MISRQEAEGPYREYLEWGLGSTIVESVQNPLHYQGGEGAGALGAPPAGEEGLARSGWLRSGPKRAYSPLWS